MHVEDVEGLDLLDVRTLVPDGGQTVRHGAVLPQGYEGRGHDRSGGLRGIGHQLGEDRAVREAHVGQKLAGPLVRKLSQKVRRVV